MNTLQLSKSYTAISRKVVAETVRATIRNVIWDTIDTLVLDTSSRPYFCCFPLALANIRSWPFLPFFEISLKNR